jgi:hypothetical protein
VQSPTTSLSSTICGREEETAVDYVIIKKKTNDNDAFLPATSAKRKRALRRHIRKSSYPSKTISHTPATFSQFERLGLRAPSYMSEVADAIDQLTARKEQYENACKAMAGQATSTTLTLSPSSPSASAHHAVTSNLLSNAEGCDDAHAVSHHFNLVKLESQLPRIDIKSAQDQGRQRQANSTTGVESAPETPNSEGSVLESIDSGIGIHRSRGFPPVISTKCTKQDDKCPDSDANTCTSSPDNSDQETVSQVPTVTQNALPKSHDHTEEYIEGSIASILGEKQALFSQGNDIIVPDAL